MNGTDEPVMTENQIEAIKDLIHLSDLLLSAERAELKVAFQRLVRLSRDQTAALADAWDEGFTKAWYEALPYDEARDASEAHSINPYREQVQP